MDIRKELFKIFHASMDQYDLYEKVIEYFERIIIDTKGEENIKFYQTLCTLMNSINNAGCEDRRHDQIGFLYKEINKISDIYERYLP